MRPIDAEDAKALLNQLLKSPWANSESDCHNKIVKECAEIFDRLVIDNCETLKGVYDETSL